MSQTLSEWARDILLLILENAEIYSTVDGDGRVLELCSNSAFANSEELHKKIEKELKDKLDSLKIEVAPHV